MGDGQSKEGGATGAGAGAGAGAGGDAGAGAGVAASPAAALERDPVPDAAASSPLSVEDVRLVPATPADASLAAAIENERTRVEHRGSPERDDAAADAGDANPLSLSPIQPEPPADARGAAERRAPAANDGQSRGARAAAAAAAADAAHADAEVAEAELANERAAQLADGDGAGAGDSRRGHRRQNSSHSRSSSEERRGHRSRHGSARDDGGRKRSSSHERKRRTATVGDGTSPSGARSHSRSPASRSRSRHAAPHIAETQSPASVSRRAHADAGDAAAPEDLGDGQPRRSSRSREPRARATPVDLESQLQQQYGAPLMVESMSMEEVEAQQTRRRSDENPSRFPPGWRPYHSASRAAGVSQLLASVADPAAAAAASATQPARRAESLRGFHGRVESQPELGAAARPRTRVQRAGSKDDVDMLHHERAERAARAHRRDVERLEMIRSLEANIKGAASPERDPVLGPSSARDSRRGRGRGGGGGGGDHSGGSGGGSRSAGSRYRVQSRSVGRGATLLSRSNVDSLRRTLPPPPDAPPPPPSLAAPPDDGRRGVLSADNSPQARGTAQLARLRHSQTFSGSGLGASLHSRSQSMTVTRRGGAGGAATLASLYDDPDAAAAEHEAIRPGAASPPPPPPPPMYQQPATAASMPSMPGAAAAGGGGGARASTLTSLPLPSSDDLRAAEVSVVHGGYSGKLLYCLDDLLRHRPAKGSYQDPESVSRCNRCGQSFGMLRRRHHCKMCGYVFCASCTSKEKKLDCLGFMRNTPLRVCDACFYKPAPETEPVVDYEVEYGNAQIELKSLHVELRSLKKHQLKLDQMRLAKAELQRQVDELLREREGAARLQEEIERRDSRLREADKALQTLRARSAEDAQVLDDERRRHRHARDRYNQEIATLKALNAELQAQLRAAVAAGGGGDGGRLRQENEALKVKLAAETARVAELTAETESESEQLRFALQAEQQRTDKTQAELAAKVRECEELQAQLRRAAATRPVDAVEKRVHEDALQQLEEYKHETQTLQTLIARLEENIRVLDDSSAQLRKRCDTLRDSYRRTKQNEEKVREELNTAKKQQRRLAAAAEEDKARIAQLVKELEAAQLELETLARERDAKAKSEAAAAASAGAGASEHVRAIQARLSKAVNELEEAQRARDELHFSKEAASKREREVMDSLVQCQLQLQTLSAERDEMRAQIDALRAAAVERKAGGSGDAEAEALRSEVERARSELEEKDGQLKAVLETAAQELDAVEKERDALLVRVHDLEATQHASADRQAELRLVMDAMTEDTAHSASVAAAAAAAAAAASTASGGAAVESAGGEAKDADTVRAMLGAREAQLEKLAAELESVSEAKRALEERVAELERRSKMGGEVEDLQERLERAALEKLEAAKARDRALQEKQALERIERSLRAELDASLALVEKMTGELETFAHDRQQLESIQRERDEKAARLEQLELQLASESKGGAASEELAARVVVLQREVQLAREAQLKQAADLEASLASLTRMAKAQADTVRALQGAVREKTDEVADMQRDAAERLAALMARNAELEKQARELRERCEALARQLEAARTDSAEAKALREQLAQARRALDLALEEQARNESALKLQVARLEASKRDLATRVAGLQDALSASVAQLDAVEQECLTLAAEVAASKAEAAQHQRGESVDAAVMTEMTLMPGNSESYIRRPSVDAAAAAAAAAAATASASAAPSPPKGRLSPASSTSSLASAAARPATSSPKNAATARAGSQSKLPQPKPAAQTGTRTASGRWKI